MQYRHVLLDLLLAYACGGAVLFWGAWFPSSAGPLLTSEAVALAWCIAAHLGRGRRRPFTLWLWTAIVVADIAYELRPAGWPRHPYNYAVEAVYTAAFCALAWRLGRHGGSGAARGWGLRAVAALPTLSLSVVLFAAQHAYFLQPLMQLAPVGSEMGQAMAWAWAASTSIGAASLTFFLLRSRRVREWGALGCVWWLFAGDFAARYAALGNDDSSAGAQTAAWSAGVVAFCCAMGLAARRGQPLRLDRQGVVGFRSLQAAVGCASALCIGAMLAGLYALGMLRLEHAHDFSQFLLLVWLAFAAVSGIALAVGRGVVGAARALPQPSLTSGEREGFAPASAWHGRVHELRVWLRAHRRSTHRLGQVMALAQRGAERRRHAQLTAELVHDLQGPLAAMQAAHETMRDGLRRTTRRTLVHAPSMPAPPHHDADAASADEYDPPLHVAVDEALTLLSGAARRAQRLCHDLLQPSAAGHRLARRRLCRAKLRRLVRQAVREAKARHQSRAQRLRWQWPAASEWPSGVRVLACPDAVAAALGVLLDNALQSDPAAEAVCVVVRAQVQRHRVRIVVCDRGLGMPAQLRARIGYGRLASHKLNGCGVGLRSAARRAAAWGGTLSCRSREHGGTACAINFPTYLDATTSPPSL